MTEEPATRAPQAPQDAQSPTPAPGSHPAPPRPPADETAAHRTCAGRGCTEPLSARRVVLVDPDGTDVETCGPYCDEDTDALVRNLFPRYSTGRPAYRIEEPDRA